MDYETGKALETINEKLDMVLMKLYPEEVKKGNEEEKEKLKEEVQKRKS